MHQMNAPTQVLQTPREHIEHEKLIQNKNGDPVLHKVSSTSNLNLRLAGRWHEQKIPYTQENEDPFLLVQSNS